VRKCESTFISRFAADRPPSDISDEDDEDEDDEEDDEEDGGRKTGLRSTFCIAQRWWIP
jgi:hypothetical protein